jgi:EAL domain-containing protein (putative c-di-GMP-specific phosphodiesterase class I)
MQSNPGDDRGEIGRLIEAVRPHFQPLLWLDDLSLAGYESLARGPAGSPFEYPRELFAAARAAGVVIDLDAVITRRSIEALDAVDWPAELTLFGNLDPDAIAVGSPGPATAQILARAAAEGTRIVMEITERALMDRPRELLRAIDVVRALGWGIAMDDVGAEEDALTMLPILVPDVVKLDMSLLHAPFDAHAARVSGTARAYCDRTGALMVCEGVETERDEARARALGADLVQGFRYGRPAPLPATVTGRVGRPIALLDRGVTEVSALAERLASVAPAELPGAQIVLLAREALTAVAGHTSAALVVATAPAIDLIPSSYLDALTTAAPHCSQVTLIAAGCVREPAPGVRGVNASAAHALGSPWSITAIGPTMAVSILSEPLAADLNDPVQHRVIHDRLTVADILRVLLATRSCK